MSLFINDNLFLNALIGIEMGGENSQYPLSNLKHNFSNKSFRSLEATSIITIDLGSIKSIDFIGIRGSFEGINFDSVTYCYSSNGSSYSGYVGIPLNVKQNIGFIFTPITCRYIKIRMLSNGDYNELANICIGKSVKLLHNDISSDLKYSKTTNNSVTKNKFGQKFIDTYSKQKLITASIKLCDASEFDAINNIHEKNGENIPLWFVLDESSKLSITDSKFIFSGFFYMKDINWTYVTNGYWDCNIDLEECL